MWGTYTSEPVPPGDEFIRLCNAVSEILNGFKLLAGSTHVSRRTFLDTRGPAENVAVDS